MLLLGAAKELQQNALFNVIVLINGWRNGTSETIIDIGLL